MPLPINILVHSTMVERFKDNINNIIFDYLEVSNHIGQWGIYDHSVVNNIYNLGGTHDTESNRHNL